MELIELTIYIFNSEGICSEDDFISLRENFLKSPFNLSRIIDDISKDKYILGHESLILSLYNRHLIVIEGTIIDLVDTIKYFDDILPNYSKFYLSGWENLQEIDDNLYRRKMSKNEIFLHLSTNCFDHKLYIY